jgi:SnoaL-like domain
MNGTAITDQLEIRALMDRYGMAVDRRDWDLYRSVFTPDARIDYADSGGPADELERIVEWLAEVLVPFAGLQHNMTNHVAEIEASTARACTYFVAFHAVQDGSGGEGVFTMGGFYQDRLARSDAGWRIVHRVELGTWMQSSYQAGIPRPPWYGTNHHHRPALPK